MLFTGNMMGMMMGNMNQKKKMEMMEEMMPKMMGGMKTEDMMGMMHKAMPKMMENCMASMSKEERKEMLTLCRGMLDKMEKKFL